MIHTWPFCLACFPCMGGPLSDADKHWQKLLQGTTFSFGPTRLNSVARILALNSFDKIERLKWAPHPSTWLGAKKRLSDEEIAFLVDLSAGRIR